MDATKIPGRFRRLFTLFWSGIFGILARNPLVTFCAGCQNLLCSFEYWRESSRIFGNFKVNQGWCQPTHEFVALSSCPIRVPIRVVAADEFKAELEVSRRHARTTRSRSRRAPLFLRRAGVPVPGGPALVSKKYGDWLKIDLSKK
mgnify:FL=1